MDILTHCGWYDYTPGKNILQVVLTLFYQKKYIFFRYGASL